MNCRRRMIMPVQLWHGHPGGHAGKGTNMTSARGVEGGSYRWPMLAVVSLGIVALTLNWFDVATAFPLEVAPAAEMG